MSEGTGGHGGAIGAWRRLLDLTGLAAGLMVALICLGVCIDVAMRWAGAGGISWMLETIEYVQYLMVLIGAAWVLARGAHVAIDAVLMAVSPAARYLIERGASAFGALCSGIFGAASLAATIDTYRTGSVLYKSITLPEWVQPAVLTLGFTMLTVEFAIQAAGRFEDREILDL
jgi:TRAP-type C4-dicarboxylate transport system permease small subunit